MATYIELADLSADATLRRKVRVATVIAAQAQMIANPGTANGRKWALEVVADPQTWGNRVLLAVLAANKSATPVQITSATDVQIQSAVDAAASGLIGAIGGA